MGDSPSRTQKSGDARKSSIKANKNDFKRYLATYKCDFSTPLDELWEDFDIDKNGFLDREEAKPFLEEVRKVIQRDRAANYDTKEFEEMFLLFDEDKNNYLTKGEMS